MTRQKMIDVLVELQIALWSGGGTTLEELEMLVLYGWKGYEDYTDEEIKEAFEGENLTSKEIKEYLEMKKERYKDQEKHLKASDSFPF
jgi:hypothetical protein